MDAIVCDPPYGIRAGARQAGHLKKNKKPLKERGREECLNGGGDSTAGLFDELVESYTIVKDLMYFASVALVDGGRLVFLLPVELREADLDEQLEVVRHHPELELLATSLQFLAGGLGRVLVTMRRRRREQG